MGISYSDKDEEDMVVRQVRHIPRRSSDSVTGVIIYEVMVTVT